MMTNPITAITYYKCHSPFCDWKGCAPITRIGQTPTPKNETNIVYMVMPTCPDCSMFCDVVF